MDSTTSIESTESNSWINRLRHRLTSVTAGATMGNYGRVLTAGYILLFAGNMMGLATAQAGNQICGTPIARTINRVAPLVFAVIVAGGLMLTYILHAYSGIKKDPQKAKEIKDWRNRAGIAAVSAPLVGKLLEIVIGIVGFGLAGCIDIIPGF